MDYKFQEPPRDDLPEEPIPDPSARDPLEIALTEFTEEKRQGKTPSIDDYALRYPDLADQIQELFPLIENLERWKTEKEVECLKRNVPLEFSFDRLGDYRLVRELGRGGMGVVFKAVHQTSQRTVAIKLLPWRFAADMALWKERLQREAVTIAALKHPNIVPIYSFSEDQGYPYYVMQFVDGVGLEKIIQQLKQYRAAKRSSKKIPPPSPNEFALTLDGWRGFAKIGEQVAIALDHAHRSNILHNDIKPSNLLVRSNGQVIVTDFGIGRALDTDQTQSDDHSVGTLRYMAPERWNGESAASSDIYSLGVTLYELVTQTAIFEVQKRPQLIEAVLNQKPISPRRVNPEIPAPFEKIILKAIAKDPADRYETAKHMARDLRRFINRQPIQTTKSGLFHTTVQWLSDWTGRWRKGSK